MSDPETTAAFEAKVLRAFVRDGVLRSIPAQEKKRLIVLRFLAESCFAADRAYTEAEVNELLRVHDEDTAALRRYMVEAGLMTRAAGIYRRTARE
jgi:hypothetical protein